MPFLCKCHLSRNRPIFFNRKPVNMRLLNYSRLQSRRTRWEWMFIDNWIHICIMTKNALKTCKKLSVNTDEEFCLKSLTSLFRNIRIRIVSTIPFGDFREIVSFMIWMMHHGRSNIILIQGIELFQVGKSREYDWCHISCCFWNETFLKFIRLKRIC